MAEYRHSYGIGHWLCQRCAFHCLRGFLIGDPHQLHPQVLPQFAEAIPVSYTHLDVYKRQEKSLVSKNPLVRILALLDRRLGKRRLLALEESMEQELDWVRAFYVIRMQAEGLMEKE